MVLVVYASKYGYTVKYANWLCEELNCLGIEADCVNHEYLSQPDTIIFCGGIYAGKIDGLKAFKKYYNLIKNKRLIYCTVGLAPTEDPSIFDKLIKHCFSEEMLNNIKIFHLRGGMNYSKLTSVHKVMMSMLKKTVEKKAVKTEEDTLFLETYGKDIDFTDKKSLEPIINYANNLEAN